MEKVKDKLNLNWNFQDSGIGSIISIENDAESKSSEES